MKVDSAIFYTNNLDRIVSFYEEKIGLELVYRRNNEFAAFQFDNEIRLGIKTQVEDREVPGSQSLIVSPLDIHTLYKNLKSKGVEIYKPLTDEDWGTKFSFLDPDGNKIEFIKRK